MPSPHRTREIAKYESRHTLIKTVTSTGATLVESDTGKLIVVDTSGGDTTITLPAAKVGLTFTIMVWKTAATKNLLINAPSSANYYKGGLVWLDTDDTGTHLFSSAPNGSSHYQLDIDDPELGSTITAITDGTYWYLQGTIMDPANAPTWA